MPGEHSFGILSGLMKLMADTTRLRIFWILCHCEECVVNLSALLDMRSPAVSHHLKLLKEAGLIISRREGKEVYYTAAQTPQTQLLHDMVEQLAEAACPVSECFGESRDYDSQVQTVNQVHELLISNLGQRYTIESLAARFHINQTTLKALFKQVYGLPVAAYMKQYRIRRAMELLQQSTLSVAQIAEQVGYENQSKFTQAFKSVTGMLPKDFRKNKI